MATTVERAGGAGSESSTTEMGLDVVSTEEPVGRSLPGLPRELGSVGGDRPGPTLICLAGLHGDEPAGVLACRRVLTRVSEDSARLQGRLVCLIGNRRALAAGSRYLDRDLNRLWSNRLADEPRLSAAPMVEAEELLELKAALRKILEGAPGQVYLLDLHTTSSRGAPFAILDDTLPNREIALEFPVTLVLGLEEELSGTLASYLTARGVIVVGFEAGQHGDPRSVGWAEAAIWIALGSCSVLRDGGWSEVKEARRLLEEARGSAPRIVEVRYRHQIEAADGFEMAPGFESFQPIRSRQVLGVSTVGQVRSPVAGRVLMPLYQELGEEGFFVVREVRPIWLRLSATLRRLRADRVLHWLPGIRRHPELPEAFLVDWRYARWLARRLFHLLGYRRVGGAGEEGRALTMVRRRDWSNPNDPGQEG